MSADTDSIEATVVATFSREMTLQLDDSRQVRARIAGKRLKPVCGDRVCARPLDNEPEWLITSILARENELTRPDSRGNLEVLAANFHVLCTTTASRPAPDWFIVDRYICAAEIVGARPIVVFNKADLPYDREAVNAELQTYTDIGYDTVTCSAKDGQFVERLERLLADKVSIIVGQSGVGKSSLINRMLGERAQKTSEVSRASGEGRHTTVNSTMLTLANGGRVIDSPGVRDFAPYIESAIQAMAGFREISAAGADCRFANCRHRHEPDCAVKSMVELGRISRRRLESMQRLIVSSEQLATSRRKR